MIFRFLGFARFQHRFTAPLGEAERPVRFLDITNPASPTGGSAEWGYQSDSGKYICQDWFAVRSPRGEPLQPGHTYTVFLTTNGKDASDHPITQSSRAPRAPRGNGADGSRARGRVRLLAKPLRDYLKGAAISPTTVLNATVFTTGPVTTPMADLATATLAAAAPTASNWVKCGAGVKSSMPTSRR